MDSRNSNKTCSVITPRRDHDGKSRAPVEGLDFSLEELHGENSPWLIVPLKVFIATPTM